MDESAALIFDKALSLGSGHLREPVIA
jgi:hypothetical protein